MIVNPKFKSLLKDPDIKFTIILGSGFHRQALGNNSIISNWEILLSRLTHSKNIKGNYILDYERIVLERCLKQDVDDIKAASKIEETEKKNLASIIKEEQKYVLKEINRFKYPNIFHSEKISDVVSLNFDTVPEYLFGKTGNISKKENKSSFNSVKKSGKLSQSFITQITSFEEIKIKNEQPIRFWHPHGSIDNPHSMVLGVAKYAELVSSTIKIRNHFKANEDKGNNNQTKDLTWLSQIYNNPVIILGASISEMEWAMWTAFVHRKRNIAKQENNHHEKPIFQMMSPEDSIDKTKHQWFEPLFTGMTFDEQWKELERLFKQQ